MARAAKHDWAFDFRFFVFGLVALTSLARSFLTTSWFFFMTMR